MQCINNGMKTTTYLAKLRNGRMKMVTRRVGKRRKPLFSNSAYFLMGTLAATSGLSLGLGFGFGTMPVFGLTLPQIVSAQELSTHTPQPPETTPGAENESSGQAAPVEVVETTEDIIYQVFGDEGELAVKIAKCESGLNPEAIGDTHIMGELNGEQIGDSVGLFQIRTGDAGVYDSRAWSRAKQYGMSVSEFREYLKNPENNIQIAKEIKDSQGWYAWANCYNKVK